MEAVTTQADLDRQSRIVAQLLSERDVRIVLAESCTAGLVSASLARIPGISRYLAGSAVVYQADTKAEWLNVDRHLIHQQGVVSRAVAKAMVTGALEATPQAEIAASITGHLGPHAPRRLDGVVYCGYASRTSGRVIGKRFVLAGGRDGLTLRRRRQKLAVMEVLTLIQRELRR